MELFNLFTQYHENTFQDFKKSLIDSIKQDIIKINQKNKHICGYKRTQNRGYCRRLCDGDACKYHLKYIENNNKYNIDKQIFFKSDVSDTSEDVNIYKNISNNIIDKDILLNIKILDPSKSNIILKNNLNNNDLKKDIEDYLFNLNSKKNIFKSLIMIVILFNKIKLKREKKRIKNKKKKERRKAKIFQSHNSHISDPSENASNVLFKEDNVYYTINFYDEKVIADNIEGVVCYFCNSIRYTNSGPCINPNCYNRTFSDTEFRIYYDKYGKHKESIYNPFLNN